MIEKVKTGDPCEKCGTGKYGFDNWQDLEFSDFIECQNKYCRNRVPRFGQPPEDPYKIEIAAVLDEFGGEFASKTSLGHLHYCVIGMAEEIIRLRKVERILTALREPSAAVIEWEDPAFPLTVADQDILAAVAAAEQEVGP